MGVKNHEKARYATVAGFIVIAFIIFGARLVDWQIVNTEIYKQKAESSSAYTIKTDAVRGEIVDANGIGLAVNETGYKVVFDKVYVDEGKENELILKIIELMKLRGEPWIDNIPVEVNSKGKYQFVAGKEDEVASFKSALHMNTYATVDNCMDKLIEKYECGKYEIKDQREIVNVRYGMTISGYDSSATSPYTFANGISIETAMIILERAPLLKGIDVRTSVVRKYVNGTVAPHLIGVTGALSAEEYQRLKGTYALNDRIGKSGIESAMEKYLKGTPGRRLVESNKSGSTKSLSAERNASPGNTVFLTLDAKLQNVLNKSLKENVENAKKYRSKDCKSGAAVVLSVKDFSILAAATYPSYDLDKYVSDNKYYNELVSDTENTPLINRAFNGTYVPGSVYKPFVACAALEEKAITETDTIYCNKIYDYYAKSGFYLKCMGHHGSIPVVRAIAKSCNVFFAETGRRVGIDNMDLYASRFGLGQKTGVELSESTGVLAGPEHSKKVGSTWYVGNTSQAALGQSDNMFTPLQLAVATATIANGGHRYRPHIVRKITDYKRENVIFENDPNKPELIKEVGVSEQNLNIIKQGMREAVLSGTGRAFSNYKVNIALKTGTAQNNKSDHVLVEAIAPYDKPEIVVVVIIAHGASSQYSKAVLRDALDAYFFDKGKDDFNDGSAKS